MSYNIDSDLSNADWLKTLRWDLPIDRDDFLQAIGGSKKLAHFLTLPAAKAMPEILRISLLDLKFNPYHDELGRFTSADGATAGGDIVTARQTALEGGSAPATAPPAPTEGTPKSAAQVLQNGGFTVATIEDADEDIQEAIAMEGSYSSEFKTQNVAQVEGIIKGVEELKQRGYDTSDILRTPIIPIHHPDESCNMATMIDRGNGRSVFLFNVAYDPDRNPEITNYGSLKWTDVFNETGSREQADEAEFRNTIFHESGHLIDELNSNQLLNEFMANLTHNVNGFQVFKHGVSIEPEAMDWIKTNLSPYAQSNAHEAMAEAFSRKLDGTLPDELEGFGKLVDEMLKKKGAKSLPAMGFVLHNSNLKKMPVTWDDWLNGTSPDFRVINRDKGTKSNPNVDEQPRDDHGRWASGGESGHEGEASAAINTGHGVDWSRISDEDTVVSNKTGETEFQSRDSAELNIRTASGCDFAYVQEHSGTLRAAVQVTRTLGEMRNRGYRMPDTILVVQIKGGKELLAGQTEFAMDDDVILGERLKLAIPDQIPPELSLDKAVQTAFGGKEANTDRYAVRTMKDIIVHEMAHIQNGPRPESLDALRRRGFQVDEAVSEVSGYAGRNAEEFLAECFVKMYRGEKLGAAASKLYEQLGGARKKSQSKNEGCSLTWPNWSTEEWRKRAGLPESEGVKTLDDLVKMYRALVGREPTPEDLAEARELLKERDAKFGRSS